MKDDRVLTVRDLHKSFRKGPEVIEVLKGIDLEAHRAEGIAIVGASGSGKSTLLHLLGGLEKPDSGSIIYGGSDISDMNDRAIARFRNARIGFVFQFHYLLPEFTALENVMIPALISSPMTSEISERAEELLDLVDLGHRRTHKPGELSGGEQQRVAIARSLMMSPGIMLADEPTGDLDPETGLRIIELFSGLRQRLDVTLLIATHNMELARTMDKVLVLKGGHLEPTVQ
ncbi:MAG TPA: ABC transporter ATP-binding protein [Deltaproteobacteria bacterium]|nr:ABC transporter ATP-binding protein [Deltaproteobacteria bacterium]HPR55114.1 ABC transporter ATP-binding protein [Deltaproteobacteria bacterium]HXK47304.1 ABC transporter ATP-binding protein [Deltaproteobacteria bacterium]